MRKGFLLVAVVVLGMAGLTGAEEDKLAVTLDLTYRSKYLSKGAEGYGQQGALFKTIDLDFSWPNIMPKGFVPRYTAHYEYPAGSHYVHNDITGWVHRFRLSYDLNTSVTPQPLHLTSDIAYNDGLGAEAHDWSYATFGLCLLAVHISTKIFYRKNKDVNQNEGDNLSGW